MNMASLARFLFPFIALVSIVKDVHLFCYGDPTNGFIAVPLQESNFEKLWPYNLHLHDRYSYVADVRKVWVYATDKPHSRSSKTKPRTEIGITLINDGYTYSSGVWQFEAEAYVPNRTTGVCIMQIFGADLSATTLMLRVYDGALRYYQQQIVEDNIYDRWFKINVIHNTSEKLVKVFVDEVLKLTVNDRGGSVHSFKFGVYMQNNNSYCMESRWKGIKVMKLPN